jgi:hypothetical protein
VNGFFIRVVLCVVFAAVVPGAAAAQSPEAVAAQLADAATAQLPDATTALAGAAAADTGCGAPQTTLVTPDSQTVATSLNNPNNQITIVFRTGNVTYWTVMLSTSVVNVVLSSNRGNAVVTFQQGLTVHLTANGSAGFNIFLSGNIVDDGTTYSLTGTYLGTFMC